MIKPDTIKFEDIEINVGELLKGNKKASGIACASWTRVQFSIPDGYSAPRAIEEWLEGNCPNKWMTYNYLNPRSKQHEHIMIVKFENKNDALFFKLRDGHKAWENSHPSF